MGQCVLRFSAVILAFAVSTSTVRADEGAPGPAGFQGQGMREQDLSRFPWNRDLRIAPVTSLDPLKAGAAKSFVEHAGVPSVIRDARKSGRLIAVFQWFPMDEAHRKSFDQVAIRISNDDGKTWGEPSTLTVQGLDLQRYQRPMDPAIVQLADGRFRLFFTSTDRMQAPGPAQRGGPAIYSAISTDLKTFTFEEGVRSDRASGGVVDATVAQHGQRYFMIAHPEARQSPFDVRQGYFATSNDGSQFQRQMNLGVSIEGDFIGNLLATGGRLHYFGGGPNGLWSMNTQDGLEWSKPLLSEVRGGDPSVFADSAGKLWMIYVGEARSDAVGELAWMPKPQGMGGGPGRGPGPGMTPGMAPGGGGMGQGMRPQGNFPMKNQGGFPGGQQGFGPGPGMGQGPGMMPPMDGGPENGIGQ